MIAEETWRRFAANWAPLAMAGLFAMLVQAVVYVLGILLIVPVALSAGFSASGLGHAGPAALISAILGMFAVVLLVLVAAVLVMPIAQGGLIHAVIQVQRGQPARFGDLWAAGLRHWGRLFRLNLIAAAVGIGLLIALAILRLVPFLGPLVWAIGAGMVMLALQGYGSYIVVSEQVGATEASSRAFRIVSAKFLDLLLTLLVLAAAGIAVGLITFILSFIPVIGKLVPLATQIFTGPLFVLYLATRYQRNIAPDLGPPGGQGTFDAGPPFGV